MRGEDPSRVFFEGTREKVREKNDVTPHLCGDPLELLVYDVFRFGERWTQRLTYVLSVNGVTGHDNVLVLYLITQTR